MKLKKITPSSPEAAIIGTGEEECYCDNRFAVINGHLFEVETYDDITFLTITEVDGLYNPQSFNHYEHKEVVEMWVSSDEKEVEALFSQRIAERLAI